MGVCSFVVGVVLISIGSWDKDWLASVDLVDMDIIKNLLY